MKHETLYKSTEQFSFIQIYQSIQLHIQTNSQYSQLLYLIIFVEIALMSPVRCHNAELGSTNVTNIIFTMVKLIDMFVKLVLPLVPPQTYGTLLIPG